MALFSRKKEEATAEATQSKIVSGEKKTRSLAKPTDRNLSQVLLSPRLTEKSVAQGERNVYTFTVHPQATKYQVREAVRTYFNVTPVRVNIVNKSPRQVMSRSKGRKISIKGSKKAYVYLKKGETISLV